MSERLQNEPGYRGYQLRDVIVLKLIKSYIMQRPLDVAREQMGRVVSPVNTWDGVEYEQEAVLNGEELASMIEAAKAEAMLDAAKWKWAAQDNEQPMKKHERLLKKSILFAREFLSALDGKEYVASMPTGMRWILADYRWALDNRAGVF